MTIDTDASLYGGPITGDGTLGVAVPIVAGGRLSLQSGVAITENDVAMATSVYLVPSVSQFAPLWDGTRYLNYDLGGELSLALDSNSGHTGYHQAGKNFHLFLINDGGTLRIGTGPAWTGDTAIGTGAGTTETESYRGVLVNKNTITIRFGSSSGNTVSIAAHGAMLVGGFRCTADAQTEDSLLKRFVWNLYQPMLRTMQRLDPVTGWYYSDYAWRQAHGTDANQTEYFCGVAGRPISAFVGSEVLNSTATPRTCSVGIGIDSTTVNSAQIVMAATPVNSFWLPTTAQYMGCPGLGYHKVVWLEHGAGADTQVWAGSLLSYLQGGLLSQVLQ